MQDTIFSFVDVETTGGSASTDRIIEIGIVRVQGGQILQKFSTLINPERTLNPFITKITGITNEMLVDAPLFHEVAEQVKELLENTIFVAHNVRFDYGFITTELRSVGIDLRLSNLCTVRLSRALFPEFAKHNLDAIVERHGLTMINRHRALDDALALVHFIDDLKHHHDAKTIENTMREILKEYILPTHLSKDDIIDIPNTTGVYRFLDKDNMPLYIGKSIHIQDRLFEHFSKATRSPKELRIVQSTHAIDYIETVGEFGALILESQLINTQHPTLNKRGRGSRAQGQHTPRRHTILQQTANPNGYLTLQEIHQDLLLGKDSSNNIAMFSTRRRAKDFLFSICSTHRLCKKILGIESGDGPCLAYGMHRCLGACVNEEPIAKYNARFRRAFSTKRIQPWPYPGMITIKEHSADSEKCELYVIQDWCIVMQGRCNYDEITWEEKDYSELFDKTIYMIIRQALSGKFARVEIIQKSLYH